MSAEIKRQNAWDQTLDDRFCAYVNVIIYIKTEHYRAPSYSFVSRKMLKR